MANLSFDNSYGEDVTISGSVQGNCNANTNYNGTQGHGKLTLSTATPQTITIKRTDGLAFADSCNACYDDTSYGLSGDKLSITVDLAETTDDKNVSIGENQPC